MTSRGEEFQRALVDASQSSQPHLAVATVLARYAGALVYLPTLSKAARRAHAARHELSTGKSEADVANLIRDRFQVSASTALRTVKAARQMTRERDAL